MHQGIVWPTLRSQICKGSDIACGVQVRIVEKDPDPMDSNDEN